MKKTIIVTLLSFLCSTLAQAYDVPVRGHYNSNGTYTQDHYRTSPNNTQSDNWGTKGNTNPYTGAPGTKSDGGNSNIFRGLK
jgi:hypothetical protein